jgi:hypothetical protein
MTTVDHTLMRGSKPHDRGCVAELPRSRNLRRVGDPADSGCEGSPDRDRAPSLARQKRVGRFAGASLGCDHPWPPIRSDDRDGHLPGDGPNKARQFTGDRGGDDIGWKSKALRAYQRRTKQADSLIAGAYLAGTNTRRVPGH